MKRPKSKFEQERSERENQMRILVNSVKRISIAYEKQVKLQSELKEIFVTELTEFRKSLLK